MLMMSIAQVFFVLLIFSIGLRLSAFFSGVETGFYRVSVLRLAIDAQDGNKRAARMLSFLQHPTRFVTTILVGNNIANYIATFAVGLGTTLFIQQDSALLEIGVTLCFAPVIFLFGELLPKTLFFRAPLALLNRNFTMFQVCYYLFLPVTWSLVLLTRRFQKASGLSELLFWGNYDENRLYYLLGQGHQEGVLAPIQNQLVHGIFEHIAARIDSMIVPIEQVQGVEENASREQVLQFAQRAGRVLVPVKRTGTKAEWIGYYIASEVSVSGKSMPRLLHHMPVIRFGMTRLDTLQLLRHQHAGMAKVVDNGRVVGLVGSKVLIEQLFRDPTPHLAGAPIFQTSGA